MKNLIKFMDKYFVPIAAKIGSQRHLVAIRDGFVAIMPLILVGSFAVLINGFPWKGFQNFMTGVFGPSWTSLGGNLWNGSFAIMSLLVSFTIAYNLARHYNSNGLTAGVISFSCLLMLYNGSALDWALPFAFLGASGLFVAIFVALVSTEIFVRLLRNKRLVIKMPESVPPAVSRSFAALLPAAITMIVFALLRIILVAIKVPDIHQAIFSLIQQPLMGLADSLGAALIIVFLVHLFWFFGLHGGNIILPVMSAVFLPLMSANVAAFKAGEQIPNVITSGFFDSFVYMGGAGTTICLLIAMVIAAKRTENRSIAKLGIGPGIFNINEPVLFGLPMVLNPIYVIPFVLTPMVITIISYLSIAIGLVPKTIAVPTWTIPPILNGFLATGSWRGAALNIVCLAIGVTIYLPFVVISENYQARAELEAKNTISM
jgi:PTS system cellobiose-specific IIC component